LGDFIVKITSKETMEKVGPIQISLAQAKQVSLPENPHQNGQLESVDESLPWVTKTARAGLLVFV
jgi:hypothetical protein